MLRIKLKRIPEPVEGTRAVVVPDRMMSPVIHCEDGDTEYVCASCETLLVLGRGDAVQNVVIRCPKCWAYNDVTTVTYN